MLKIDYNILHIIDNQLVLTLSWHSYIFCFWLGKRKKIIYPSELFFFLYVSLNFPYIARLCASNLAKHMKKITSSFGVDYFLPLP